MSTNKVIKVFLGVPVHKGETSASTCSSVIQASSCSYTVQFQILGLSLLAKNFNILFCNAWRKNFDYFALLHSDIGVQQPATGTSWVESMIRRMIDLKAAVVAAVPPIKSPAGHTSTALELEAGNPYNMRRMTVREMHELPYDIISREDLCAKFGVSNDRAGALLINTGCLVMDLRNYDWCGAQWPGFNIYDKIVWNTSRRPESYTVPEDWALSRWLHIQKWPYYALRDIGIHHFGHVDYNNNTLWGEESDTFCGQISPEEYERT